MKINLNVRDRLTIISILPSTGSLVDLVEIMDLVKTIKFSEEEKKEIGYTITDGGTIKWNSDKDVIKEFEINLDQIKILKRVVSELDSKKQITLSILDTCLKINKL